MKNWLARRFIGVLPSNSGERDVGSILASADEANRARNWSDALVGYQKVLGLQPNLAAIWVQKGHCEKEQGLYMDAVNSYRTAIQTDGKHWDAYVHLADLKKRLGERVEAFNLLFAAWEATNSDTSRADLEALIGSTSPFPDVIKAMKSSFSSIFYSHRYRDVFTSGVDPLVHYLLFGWREGRSPNGTFDPGFYMKFFGQHVPEGNIPFVHYETFGKAMGLRGSRLEDRSWFSPKAPDGSCWREVAPALVTATTRAVVILPVYRGRDETLASIYHALHSRGSADYGLVVVNDCSPDEELSRVLSELAEAGLFTYHRNASNLGFVKSVNHAVNAYANGRDVVLLNSDAFVFSGWFERLSRHSSLNAGVATVTPLSNNATICSYPNFEDDNGRAIECSPQELDSLVAESMSGVSIDSPTGVGFCMFISGNVIAELGLFDEVAFGRGYGEENDFCMRAYAAGYRNLIAHDVFVYHVGSVSFAESKVENVRRGESALAQKHPSYSTRVGLFLKSDPGRRWRRRIDTVRLAKALPKVTVFVSHQWGGGIERYLRDEIDALREDGSPHLVLRVHDGHFVSVETDGMAGLHVPNLSRVDLRFESRVISDMLASLNIESIIVNSFAGLDWCSHRKLIEIISDANVSYNYVIHDYSCVSHNLNLMRPDGLDLNVIDWEGVADVAFMQNSDYPDVSDPAERLLVYRHFLLGARSVVAPSVAARSVVSKFHPDVSVSVVPHREPPYVEPRAAVCDRGDELRVAVVGAISVPKGFLQLVDIAGDVRARSLPVKYYLVGYSSDDALLSSLGVWVSGRYAGDPAALRHLGDIKPHFILIPSVCHETYCYALSLARRAGIVPVVFDVGAQAERIGQWGWGHVIELGNKRCPKLINDDLVRLFRDRVSYRIQGG